MASQRLSKGFKSIIALLSLYPLVLIPILSHSFQYPPFYISGFTELDARRVENWGRRVSNPKLEYGIPYSSFEVETHGILNGPGGKTPLTLRGWFVPAPYRSSHLAILVHGAGVDRREMLRHVPMYHHLLGWNCVLFDVSDHGNSGKRLWNGVGYGPQEAHDIQRVSDFWASPDGTELLAQHNQPPVRHIVLQGASNGAASALIAAGQMARGNDTLLRAVVAENPFACAQRELREMFDHTLGVWMGRRGSMGTDGKAPVPGFLKPLLPALIPPWIRDAAIRLCAWRLRLQGNAPRDHVGAIGVPLLLMHSTTDRMISIDHSHDLLRTLWAARTQSAAPGVPTNEHLRAMASWSPPVHFWSVDGADHSLLSQRFPVEYPQRVVSFLRDAATAA